MNIYALQAQLSEVSRSARSAIIIVNTIKRSLATKSEHQAYDENEPNAHFCDICRRLLKIIYLFLVKRIACLYSF